MRTPVLPTIALAGGGLLALAGLSSPPAAAAEPVPLPVQSQSGPLADLEALLKVLEGWMKRFPTYSAPEVLPNGDIIIRRNRPEPAPRAPSPHPGHTDT